MAEEAALIGPAYEKFGERLPQELWDELAALNDRLDQISAPAKAMTAAE